MGYFAMYHGKRRDNSAPRGYQSVKSRIFINTGLVGPSRVLRWSPYFMYLLYPWVLSIARVWEWSEQFYSKKSRFSKRGGRWDIKTPSCTQKRKSTIFINFEFWECVRVLRWSPYFMYLLYRGSWVYIQMGIYTDCRKFRKFLFLNGYIYRWK